MCNDCAEKHIKELESMTEDESNDQPNQTFPQLLKSWGFSLDKFNIICYNYNIEKEKKYL